MPNEQDQDPRVPDGQPQACRPTGSTASSNELIHAFVQGAAWWEWVKTGATMWASDKALAAEMAVSRMADGTLGLSDDDRLAVIRRRLDTVREP